VQRKCCQLICSSQLLYLRKPPCNTRDLAAAIRATRLLRGLPCGMPLAWRAREPRPPGQHVGCVRYEGFATKPEVSRCAYLLVRATRFDTLFNQHKTGTCLCRSGNRGESLAWKSVNHDSVASDTRPSCFTRRIVPKKKKRGFQDRRLHYRQSMDKKRRNDATHTCASQLRANLRSWLL
jgi:hypothetical protein